MEAGDRSHQGRHGHRLQPRREKTRRRPLRVGEFSNVQSLQWRRSTGDAVPHGRMEMKLKAQSSKLKESSRLQIPSGRWRTHVFGALSLVLLLSFKLCPLCFAAARPPNFVLIFVDNLGNGDLKCFNPATPHRTPNVDRLAAGGTKFTSFYVSSGVCTPSRASLMTGCYPMRVNMHVSGTGTAVLRAVDSKGLNPDETTIAE